MMTKESVPTVEQAREIVQDQNFLGAGCYREVYRKAGSRWVVKVDSNGEVNRTEYQTYVQFRPSLTKDIYFPEMHLLENGMLVAEYVEGSIGDFKCWNYKNSVIGCARNCETECWAKRIEFLAKMIKDLHYQNIRITDDGKIYIIDLGEGLQRKTESDRVDSTSSIM